MILYYFFALMCCCVCMCYWVIACYSHKSSTVEPIQSSTVEPIQVRPKFVRVRPKFVQVRPQVQPKIKQKQIKYQKICVICLLDLDNKQSVKCCQCGHCFHKACINKWLASHTTCPTCRNPCESIHQARPIQQARYIQQDRLTF